MKRKGHKHICVALSIVMLLAPFTWICACNPDPPPDCSAEEAALAAAEAELEIAISAFTAAKLVLQGAQNSHRAALQDYTNKKKDEEKKQEAAHKAWDVYDAANTKATEKATASKNAAIKTSLAIGALSLAVKSGDLWKMKLAAAAVVAASKISARCLEGLHGRIERLQRERSCLQSCRERIFRCTEGTESCPGGIG